MRRRTPPLVGCHSPSWSTSFTVSRVLRRAAFSSGSSTTNAWKWTVVSASLMTAMPEDGAAVRSPRSGGWQRRRGRRREARGGPGQRRRRRKRYRGDKNGGAAGDNPSQVPAEGSGDGPRRPKLRPDKLASRPNRYQVFDLLEGRARDDIPLQQVVDAGERAVGGAGIDDTL